MALLQSTCFLLVLIILCSVQHFSGVAGDSASERFVLGRDAEIQSYLATTSQVTHMEPDKFIPGSILLSSSYYMKSVTNEGGSLIVGDDGEEVGTQYREGVGRSARFGCITGFYQLTATLTILVDQYYNCLRLLNRITNETSHYAGTSTLRGKGYKSGTESKFSRPHSIIADAKNSSSLLITDTNNDAIRVLNWRTSVVSTFYFYSRTLSYVYCPSGIAQDGATGDLFITSTSQVFQLNYESRYLTVLSGFSQSIGFSEGSFSDGQFSFPHGILLMNNNTQLLVADRQNNRLRILDLISQTITYICSGAFGYTNGDMESCELAYPRSLMLLHNTLFIGESGSVRMIHGGKDRGLKQQTSAATQSSTEDTGLATFPTSVSLATKISPSDTTIEYEHSTATEKTNPDNQNVIVYTVLSVSVVIIVGLLVIICCLWKWKNTTVRKASASGSSGGDIHLDNDADDPYVTVTDDPYYITVIADPPPQQITSTYLQPRAQPPHTHLSKGKSTEPTDPEILARHRQVLQCAVLSQGRIQRNPAMLPLPCGYAHTPKFDKRKPVNAGHASYAGNEGNVRTSGSNSRRLGYVDDAYSVHQLDDPSVVPTDIVVDDYLRPVN